MKSKTGYLPEAGAFPFEGLDTSAPSVSIPPTSAVVATNLTTFRGTLTKRQDFAQLGTTTFDSQVLRFFNFQDSHGNSILMAFTLTKVYAYGSIASLTEWVDITPVAAPIVVLPKVSGGNGWTASGTIPVGSYVVQATSLAVGQWLLENGISYFVRVISGVFDATHTINYAGDLPSYVSATVTKSGTTTATANTTAVPFHATLSSWWDVTDGVDTNLGRIVIFTNGIDPVMHWDGTTAVQQLTVNLTGFCTCKALAVFHDYLILLNFQVNGGTFETQSLVWSDTGLFTEWLSGNAGEMDDLDVEGNILRAIPYANNLVIFSQQTISSIYYVDSTIIFGQQTYVTNITLAGPGAVCQISPYIAFAGLDNFYTWDGGRSVTPFGDKLALDWQSAIADGNSPERAQFCFDQTRSQLWFFEPIVGDTITTFCAEVLISDKQQMRWFEVDDLDSTTLAVYRTGETSQKIVVGTTETALMQNVASTSMTIEYQTGYFSVSQELRSLYARWVEFEMEMTGNGSLEISWVDEAGVKTLIDTVGLRTTVDLYKLPFDVTKRMIALHFTGSVYSFSMNWFRVWFRPGGAR